MSEYRLKIGITQGDTNGIGWEVILHTLADSRLTELFTPVVYGSQQAAKFYASTLDKEEGTVQFNVVTSADEARKGKVNLVECGDAKPQPGVASKEAGKAAVEALQTSKRAQLMHSSQLQSTRIWLKVKNSTSQVTPSLWQPTLRANQ